MKLCTKCNQNKQLADFYIRQKGSRAGEYYNHCKDCLKARGRSYYHLNHEKQLLLATQRIKTRRKSLREFVNTLKDKPCTDCGRKYPPYVMDFDHKNHRSKLGNIGTIISQMLFTKEKLLQEIGKCDLVCANCHRIRTYKNKLKPVTGAQN